MIYLLNNYHDAEVFSFVDGEAGFFSTPLNLEVPALHPPTSLSLLF